MPNSGKTKVVFMVRDFRDKEHIRKDMNMGEFRPETRLLEMTDRAVDGHIQAIPKEVEDTRTKEKFHGLEVVAIAGIEKQGEKDKNIKDGWQAYAVVLDAQGNIVKAGLPLGDNGRFLNAETITAERLERFAGQNLEEGQQLGIIWRLDIDKTQDVTYIGPEEVYGADRTHQPLKLDQIVCGGGCGSGVRVSDGGFTLYMGSADDRITFSSVVDAPAVPALFTQWDAGILPQMNPGIAPAKVPMVKLPPSFAASPTNDSMPEIAVFRIDPMDRITLADIASSVTATHPHTERGGEQLCPVCQMPIMAIHADIVSRGNTNDQSSFPDSSLPPSLPPFAMPVLMPRQKLSTAYQAMQMHLAEHAQGQVQRQRPGASIPASRFFSMQQSHLKNSLKAMPGSSMQAPNRIRASDLPKSSAPIRLIQPLRAAAHAKAKMSPAGISPTTHHSSLPISGTVRRFGRPTIASSSHRFTPQKPLRSLPAFGTIGQRPVSSKSRGRGDTQETKTRLPGRKVRAKKALPTIKAKDKAKGKAKIGNFIESRRPKVLSPKERRPRSVDRGVNAPALRSSKSHSKGTPIPKKLPPPASILRDIRKMSARTKPQGVLLKTGPNISSKATPRTAIPRTSLTTIPKTRAHEHGLPKTHKLPPSRSARKMSGTKTSSSIKTVIAKEKQPRIDTRGTGQGNTPFAGQIILLRPPGRSAYNQAVNALLPGPSAWSDSKKARRAA